LTSEGSAFLDPEQRIAEGTVLVTGMAGRLGRRLARRLHRVRNVTGLGPRAPRHLPSDVEHLAVSPLRSAARPLFRRPDIGAIVHLGVTHNPKADQSQAHSENLLAFQKVIEYAAQFKIPKVVLLSSGNTYGPRADNAQFLTEKAPLLAGGRFSEMHALVQLDMYAQSCFWRHPDLELVVLRPANILGTVRNAPSNYLRLKVVPTLMGFDPMVQAVHQDDVVSAIELALRPGARGIFNIAGPKPVPISRAVEILKRKSVTVPYSLARGGLKGLFRLGMSKFPAPELDFIRYVCMVDDSAARQTLGYAPKFGLEETLRAVDEERWA
jgi:UDP-glucose 4-epimerase